MTTSPISHLTSTDIENARATYGSYAAAALFFGVSPNALDRHRLRLGVHSRNAVPATPAAPAAPALQSTTLDIAAIVANAVAVALQNAGISQTPVPAQVAAVEAAEEAPAVSNDNSSILVISDLHAPYQHPDALEFLAALRDAYQPTRVICTGDETDGHAISFHTSSPNLPSAGQETDQARAFMRAMHAEFPVLDLVHSNHGSLIYRRQQDGGLPDHAMQSYRGFLFGEKQRDGSTLFPDGIGRQWRWSENLEIELPSGEMVLFVHGFATNVKLAVQKTGMSVVQGHYHSEYDCVALQGPRGLARFGITGGCLIDPESYAFAYGRTIPKRPVIGCSGILDGQPVQFRMPLDSRGRWTSRLPYNLLPGRRAA